MSSATTEVGSKQQLWYCPTGSVLLQTRNVADLPEDSVGFVHIVLIDWMLIAYLLVRCSVLQQKFILACVSLTLPREKVHQP